MSCWKNSLVKKSPGLWLCFGLVALLLLLGCGRRTVERHYYLLALPEFSPDSLHLSPINAAFRVMVVPVEVNPPFAQRHIASRSRPYEIQYFVQHQWAAIPETMLADFIKSYFARSKTFAYNIPLEYTTEPDFLIDSRLQALEVIPSGGKLVAHLAMSLYLLDRFKGRVLVSHVFDREVPLKHKNLNEFASVLSRLLLNELIRFDRDIRQYIAKTKAPATP